MGFTEVYPVCGFKYFIKTPMDSLTMKGSVKWCCGD